MITFITLFRGDHQTTKNWVDAFNLTSVPSGSKLIAVCPIGFNFDYEITNGCEVSVHFEEPLYRSTHPDGPEYDKKWNIDKSAFVARLNSKYSAGVDTRFICFWNDDVSFKSYKMDDIDLILSHFARPEVVNVFGLYPYRDIPYLAVARYLNSRGIARVDQLQGKATEVFCGGPGFSFWCASYLKKILPIVDHDKMMDTSFYPGLMMERDKKTCICEGRVVLYHKV